MTGGNWSRNESLLPLKLADESRKPKESKERVPLSHFKRVLACFGGCGNQFKAILTIFETLSGIKGLGQRFEQTHAPLIGAYQVLISSRVDQGLN